MRRMKKIRKGQWLSAAIAVFVLFLTAWVGKWGLVSDAAEAGHRPLSDDAVISGANIMILLIAGILSCAVVITYVMIARRMKKR